MILHDVVIDEQELAACCKRYGVSQLWLFGSILRNSFRPDSDVDVLIDNHRPIGLFRLGGLREELTELLGRPVHLTTLNSVPERLKPELLADAQLRYAG